MAEKTSSPTDLSTGRLSPVIADWSKAHWPDVITPSQGTLSPARITIRSPTLISSTATVISFPSTRIFAVLGVRAISDLMALEVFPLDRLSSILPRVIKVTIIAAPSKYTSIKSFAAKSLSPPKRAR